MEALTPAVIAVGAVNIVAFPLLLWFIKRYLERFDAKREDARIERRLTRRGTPSRPRTSRRPTH
jgi:hypothetical protein